MGDMIMKLMTSEIKRKIPALRAQEGLGWDAVVHVKLFDPTGSATWWITEYDPEEEIAFGYVTGMVEDEWGYVSLKEISSVRVRYGLGIERDLSHRPKPLSECLRKHT
ncbi:MAG: DUF2958 domain-containing protein [Gammaproteobacteria bacterium]|nr:DUF2958 domain-containing protein [Gammaproteobacteria bacterium]